MRKIFILLFTSISLFSLAQSSSELKQIDQDYNKYLKDVFEPSFNNFNPSKKNHKNLIFGNLTKGRNLMNVTDNKTFSVSVNGKTDKLTAALLYGINHFSTYEFLADDYEQTNSTKELVMKEFLRIKIHVIPDINSMKIGKSQKVNKLETINQFKVSNLKKLNTPIIVTYYTSQLENGSSLNKNVTTKITHRGNVLYSSTKAGVKSIIKHNNHLNANNFIYKNGNQKIITSGGLMDLAINNMLKEIKSNIHMEALNVSNVSDLYKNQNKDLKRISNTGKVSASKTSAKDILGMN